MLAKPIVVVFLVAVWWLIRRDNRLREDTSATLWIPTLWVGIISSRPLSMWLGFGGGSDTLEGSPMDALSFLVMICAALIVLSRRRVVWPRLISENWSLWLFYGFLLISVVWAYSPTTSFKRWFKELGNIFILLVILTEVNPQQALRTVFFRCGCLLMPLSYIFIRWFPDLGRRYNIHSGEMEAIGVTCQKNSLGAMILVCSLIIFWDWLELRKLRQENPETKLRFDLNLRIVLLLCGAYLLYLCDSKTSMTCLILGLGVLTAACLPLIRLRLRILGVLAIVGFLGYLALNQAFDLQAVVLHGLGRNADLTGRTEVWQTLLNAGTDPILGTGYMSFWDNPGYQSKLPDGDTVSAHNGWLEIYLCDGAVGVLLLLVMLLASCIRIYQSLVQDGDYGVVRFAVLLVALLANYTETNFAWMTPIGFLFLTASIGHAEAAAVVRQSDELMVSAEASGGEEFRVGDPAASIPD